MLSGYDGTIRRHGSHRHRRRPVRPRRRPGVRSDGAPPDVRCFASNTLRGVHRDAEHIAAPIAAYASKALAAYGR
ncbi:hypothetical protein EJK15_22315 [Nonomuraea basaltis]|nr:hypothetical protein EJK15_22315 [Nonomuraea basaltis]